MRDLSLFPLREDHSPVRVTSKTGKKRLGESNDQEKRKKIRPSEKVFNQHASQMDGASQTDGYDSEFERESQSVQSLNFQKMKVQKIDNQCEIWFGDDLTKHVKDLTMTNKLKRSEGYYQSKYSNNKYSEDYAKYSLTLGSLF